MFSHYVIFAEGVATMDVTLAFWSLLSPRLGERRFVLHEARLASRPGVRHRLYFILHSPRRATELGGA